MAKTIAEIQQGLQAMYDGPIFEKNNFPYIPWNEAAKIANDVFGIDGYDVDVLETRPIGSAGYSATVKVTVYPTDSRSFYRVGIGFNELTGDNGRAHDTAVKGAASDALNRALKLFGTAFGLNLYDKSETPTGTWKNHNKPAPTGNAAAGAQKTVTVPNTEGTSLVGLLDRKGQQPAKDGYIGNVSPKQAENAQKQGWSADALERLTRDEVRVVMDGVFGKGPKVTPPTVNAASAAPAKKPAPAPVAVAAPADDDDAFLASFLGSDDE